MRTSRAFRRDLVAIVDALTAMLVYPVAAGAIVLTFMSVRTPTKPLIYAALGTIEFLALLIARRCFLSARRARTPSDAEFFRKIGFYLLIAPSLGGILATTQFAVKHLLSLLRH